MQFLTYISRWEFVKNLHNPNGFLFQDYPIKVEFIRSDGTAIEIRDDQIILDYEQIDGEYTGKFKIKLTNQFHQRLFVSFLYLSLNFEVYTELLPQGTIGLDPGHSAWIAEGDFLELEYEAQVEHHNWKYSITYFKLIANTAFNDISKLQLGALPSPMEGISRAGRADRARQTQPNANDWITRLLCLKLRNPKYVDTES